MFSLLWCTFVLISFIDKNFGTPASSGSCAQYGCGTYNSHNSCQCNDYCDTYNDCCSDFYSLCASCSDVGCNYYANNRECECNPDCVYDDTCCDDYEDVCNAHIVTQCKAAPAVSGDRRTDKSRLRFMEYNMEWLFTNYTHSMGSIECPGDCAWPNYSIAHTHMIETATYIANLDPDVLFVEEVSDCWQLQKLIDAMPSSSSSVYVPYLLLGTDTATGENCGLITKIDPIQNLSYSEEYVDYPISTSTCGYTGSGSTGCSKHFMTKLKVDGIDKPITIVGVHFIAYPTETDRCAKREAQATIIANSFIEPAYEDGDYIIVAGDFNDYDNDVLDAADDVPLSTVTEIIKSAGDLVNVAAYISDQSERYTAWYDENGDCVDDGNDENTMIDQFMMSQSMTQYISNVFMDHSYVADCWSTYSDHWPVIVDLNLTVEFNKANH